MKQDEERGEPPGRDENNSRYKSLIISNIAEAYYHTYKKLSKKDAEWNIKYDFLESERAVSYDGDKKIVITSMPLDSEYVRDLQEIVGYRDFLPISPPKPTESICSDIMNTSEFFSNVLTLIKQNPGIEIIPYVPTGEFFDLIALLKQQHVKFTTPETVLPKNRFIRDHYNCKVGFRKLWEKSNDDTNFVNIPDGFIVDDLDEAVDAAWWFTQNKKGFVMKYSRGQSGLGVVFYKYEEVPKEEKAFKDYLRSKHTDRIWFEENFVVEEYIDVDTAFYGGSPSLEFKINGELRHTYNGVQRLNKDSYFEGFIISKQIEEESGFDFERIVESCMPFGEALQELGYRGIFDVDLVIDKKHNIFAVESNLRRTGATHVFETAQYVFGKNFMDKIVVASKDNLPVSKEINTYQKFKAKASHLFFSREKGEGIIPLITSFLPTGKIAYIIFAPTLDRMGEIEKELGSLVS